MNSLLKPETVPKESPLATDSTSGVAAKVDEVKKVRLSVDEKETSSKKDVNEDSKNEERKRHASAGQQQVKSLYDGLSHLYADCDSRLKRRKMKKRRRRKARRRKTREPQVLADCLTENPKKRKIQRRKGTKKNQRKETRPKARCEKRSG